MRGYLRHTVSYRFPAFLTVLFTVVYSAYGLVRHMRFGSSGFDLGIFDQLLYKYSHLAVPANTIRDVPNLLGDHFHPLLLLLTPFYWIHAGPETLILIQAALVSSAVIPLFLYAREKIGDVSAHLLSVAFLLFWGIAHMVAYDFHEIALAIPLIAWAIYFLEKENFRILLVTLALVLLVKEDQSLLVAFFGVLLLLRKRWTLGFGILVGAAGWLLLTTKVIIPALSGEPYVYWSFAALGPGPFPALIYVLTHPFQTIHLLIDNSIKRHTLWMLFNQTLFLSFFSPLIVLSIPLVAARFLSSNPSFWSQDFHYSATIAPVLFFAAIDTLKRIHVLVPKKVTAYVIPVICTGILLVSLLTFVRTPLRSLWDPAFLGLTPEMQAGYTALGRIPDDASVAAQDGIVPHLSLRSLIYTLNPQKALPDVDYLVTSTQVSSWPATSYNELTDYIKATDKYEVYFFESGWTVYKHR